MGIWENGSYDYTDKWYYYNSIIFLLKKVSIFLFSPSSCRFPCTWKCTSPYTHSIFRWASPFALAAHLVNSSLGLYPALILVFHSWYFISEYSWISYRISLFSGEDFPPPYSPPQPLCAQMYRLSSLILFIFLLVFSSCFLPSWWAPQPGYCKHLMTL